MAESRGAGAPRGVRADRRRVRPQEFHVLLEQPRVLPIGVAYALHASGEIEPGAADPWQRADAGAVVREGAWRQPRSPPRRSQPARPRAP